MKGQTTAKKTKRPQLPGKIYTNPELANLYLGVIHSFNEAFAAESPYRAIMHRISEMITPIHPFYLRKGSLAGLKLRGLGEKTKTVLEALLRKSAVGVRPNPDSTIIDTENARIQPRSYRVKRQIPKEYPGGVEGFITQNRDAWLFPGSLGKDRNDDKQPRN